MSLVPTWPHAWLLPYYSLYFLSYTLHPLFVTANLYFFFKNFFIYFTFRRKGAGGRKRGRETSVCKRNIDWLPLTHPQPGTWSTTQARALTRNQTGDLLVHRPRPALNPRSHTSQGLNLYFLVHRWQTQAPQVESGPPPCFIQPRTLFLPWGSAKLLAPS